MSNMKGENMEREKLAQELEKLVSGVNALAQEISKIQIDAVKNQVDKLRALVDELDTVYSLVSQRRARIKVFAESNEKYHIVVGLDTLGDIHIAVEPNTTIDQIFSELINTVVNSYATRITRMISVLIGVIGTVAMHVDLLLDVNERVARLQRALDDLREMLEEAQEEESQ